MTPEAILAFLLKLDEGVSSPTMTYEEGYLILRNGLSALASALETTVKPKENNQ